MTAQELYRIVSEIPKDAWPDALLMDKHGASFDDDQMWGSIREDHIELLFIGSMVKWLLDKELVVWQGTEDGVFRVGEWNSSTAHEGASILAALAAACKAVGGAE